MELLHPRIRDAVLPDGQIVCKRITPTLDMLDDVIVHHADTMYDCEHPAKRIEWLVSQAQAPLIEVGTATGYVLSKMTGQRAGIDIDVARLLLASKRYPDIDFYYGNVLNLDPFFNGGFNTLIVAETLEHLPYEHVHYALHHCLMVAPKVIITLPRHENVMTNPEHRWHPNPEAIGASADKTNLVDTLSLTQDDHFLYVTLQRKIRYLE